MDGKLDDVVVVQRIRDVHTQGLLRREVQRLGLEIRMSRRAGCDTSTRRTHLARVGVHHFFEQKTKSASDDKRGGDFH